MQFKIDQGVDWSAPWLAAVKAASVDIVAASDWRLALNTRVKALDLRNHLGHELRFIAQEQLPPGQSYEAHISATGEVPTRDNLHDFFNALVWLAFPRIKVRLNALQAAQIARLGVGQSRGAARDAATLFDENAALLAVADTPSGHALVHALHEHQWQQLFVQERAQFLTLAEPVLFGHALMEKLVNPYKAITAHTLVCWVEPAYFSLSASERRTVLDQQIALQLSEQLLLPSAFSPLPVLGVPGWWPDQHAEFYADSSVFRPKRQRK